MLGPEIADVCSCAGLGADGYAAVGLLPHGYDHEPQPDYPYPFTKADVRDLVETDALDGYDARHFSLPCQWATTAGRLRDAQGGTSKYPDMLTPLLPVIRDRYRAQPWVIENVDDNRGVMRRIMAPQPGESLVRLCGSMFGLEVQRHRLFLSNVPLRPGYCDHSRFPLDPHTGKPRPWGVYHVKGDKIPSGGRTALDEEHGRHVMGSRRLLPWDKLKEGFPPAYTSYVGADLLRAIQ